MARAHHSYGLGLLASVLVSLSLIACTMNSPSRNMNLKAFDPHRAEFTCKYEADATPPITQEAEALFQQGMAATSYELNYPEDRRDFARAAQLWKQAADQGHWKAALNLAGLYETGRGVEHDTEKAVLIVEGLMKQGVPAAFYKMGTYHREGTGVKPDSNRAYGFWQLAADMGNAAAQAFIGEKLDAVYDNPNQGFWGNREIGLKMLECSYAQGNSKAAFELGLTLGNRSGKTADYYVRALKILHDAVKFGNSEAAGYMSASFNKGGALVGHQVDAERADRYHEIRPFLERNPDLRLPNLDKVLPLPPADLPVWDGKPESLIDAAKGLIRAPDPKPTPGSQRTGRAHIPQGHVLTGAAHPDYLVEGDVPVPYTGYWLPRFIRVYRDHEREWEAAQVPLHYAAGESFDTQTLRASLGKTGMVTAPSIVWSYAGRAVAQAQPVDPKVAQGIARVSRVPQPQFICRGHRPCPRTGIWYSWLPDGHPLVARYNRWDRQAYLEEGEAFPDPKKMQPDLAASDVQWLWCDNANRTMPNGLVHVTLSDLHDPRGDPMA